MLQMTSADYFILTGFSELLSSVLPDRFQHTEPLLRFREIHNGFFGKILADVEHVIGADDSVCANRFGIFKFPTAVKYGKPPPHYLLFFIKKVMAPVYHCAECLLPRQCSPVPPF